MSSYRDRLVRFYKHYAPDKLSLVDEALTKFAGKEDKMFEALVAKYGAEPAVEDAAAQPSQPQDYRARLTRYFQVRAPDKLTLVDQMLQKYAGKEEDMFKALSDRFGPEPPAASPAASASSFRDRLVRFYKHYAPDKLSLVDEALTKFAGKEDKMFEALVAKYGAEPAVEDAAAQPSQPQDNRARLTRYFQVRAPDKLTLVDQMLEKYAGKEEEMFKALAGRFGPEPVGAETAPPAPPPPSQPAAAAGPEVSQAWKARLQRYFTKYAPDRLGNVDAILQKNAGKEEDLFKALVAKFGPEPSESTEAGAADSQAEALKPQESKPAAQTAPQSVAPPPPVPAPEPPKEEKFSYESHMFKIIGSRIDTLLRVLSALIVTDESSSTPEVRQASREFLFCVGLWGELFPGDLPKLEDTEQVKKYPVDITEFDKAGYHCWSHVKETIREEAVEADEICASEHSDRSEIQKEMSEDLRRMESLEQESVLYKAKVLSKALEMLPSVEAKLRAELENGYNMEFSGRVKWFKTQRDRLLLLYPAQELTAIQQKYDHWKNIVQTNRGELLDWMAKKRAENARKRRLAEALLDLQTGYRRNALPDTRRNQLLYGTRNSPHYPMKTQQTPRPEWGFGEKLTKPEWASKAAITSPRPGALPPKIVIPITVPQPFNFDEREGGQSSSRFTPSYGNGRSPQRSSPRQMMPRPFSYPNAPPLFQFSPREI